MKKLFLLTGLFIALLESVFSQDVNVTITPQDTVRSCKDITFNVIVKNLTPFTLYNVKLDIYFSSGFCFLSCSNLDSCPSPGTGTQEFILGDIDNLDSVSFAYTGHIQCEMFDNPPINNGVLSLIHRSDSIAVFSHNAPLALHDQPAPYDIYYSYFAKTDTAGVSQFGHISTPSLTRILAYKNTGFTALTNGRIHFKDNHGTAIKVMKIKFDLVKPNGTIFPIDSSGSGTDSLESDISNITVGKNDKIRITETIKIVKCLEIPNSGQSDFEFKWGCAASCTQPGTDLCISTLKEPFVVQRGVERPDITISRAEPGNLPGTSYPLEKTCPGENTHWKFYITNYEPAGTLKDYTYKTYVILDKGFWPQSYTYVNLSSVHYSIKSGIPIKTDTTILILDRYPGVKNPWLLDSAYNKHNVENPFHQWKKPGCLQDNSSEALFWLALRIDTLKTGDTLTLEFDTYRCCVNDTFLLDSPDETPNQFYNRWFVKVSGREECDTTIYYYTASARDTSAPYKALYSGGISSNLTSYDADDYDLSLKQNYDAQVTDMDGAQPGDTVPTCNEVEPFVIENIQFKPNSSTDFNLLGASPRGKVIVKFNLDLGLKIDIDDYDSIKFVKDTVSWSASVTDITPYNTFEHQFVATFDIHSKFSTPLELRNFLEGSQLRFRMTACCPAKEPTSFYYIKTYLQIDSADAATSCSSACEIPLSVVSGQINVHCPGCLLPGMIADKFTLKRINYGFQDTNDDGIADSHPPIPINSSYSQFNNLKLNRGVSGDILEGELTAHFEGGTHVDGHGYTYAELKALWQQINPNGLPNSFKYMYLKQTIPYSSVTGVDLQLDSLKLTIKRGALQLGNIIFSSADLTDTNTVMRSGNDYFFKFDSVNIVTHGGDSLYSYEPGDVFLITTQYHICGNFTPADPLNNPIPTGKLKSEINNLIYFSGVPKTINSVASDAGTAYSAGYDSSVLKPDLFYWCEQCSNLFNFYSVENLNFETWGDVGASLTKCTKAVTIQAYSRMGGGAINIFPFEFKPLAVNAVSDTFHIQSLTLHLPDLPSSYKITDLKTFTAVYNHNDIQYLGGYSQFPIPQPSYNPTDTTNFFLFNDSMYEYVDSSNFHTGYSTMLIGDERYDQYMQIALEAQGCSNDNGHDSIITPAVMAFPAPSCQGGTDPGLFSFYGTTVYQFSQSINLPLSINIPQKLIEAAASGSHCWDVTLKMQSGGSAENSVLYFSNDSGFTNIHVDSISAQGQYINFTADTNGLFHLGTLLNNTSLKLRICADYTCLDTINTGIERLLHFKFASACGGYPDSINDPDICFSKNDTLKLREALALFSAESNSNSSNYYLCTSSPFTGCIKSREVGGFHNFSVSLDLPSNLILDTNNITASYICDGCSSSVFFTPDSTSIGVSPYEWKWNLSAFDTAYGVNDLNLNEQLCFSFNVTPICGYDGTLPSLLFTGYSYCDQQTSDDVQFDSWILSGDSCTSSCNSNCSAYIVADKSYYCEGETVNLTAYYTPSGSASYTYIWTGPDNFTDTITSANAFSTVSISSSQIINQGLYSVSVTDGDCITDTGIDVTIVDCDNSCSAYVVGDKNYYCEGETVHLTAYFTPMGSLSYTYIWSGPDNFADTITSNYHFCTVSIPSTQLVNQGLYSVSITDGDCMVTATKTVAIYSTTSPYAYSNSPVCEGNNVQLFESVGVYSSYSWTGPNGFTSSLQNPVVGTGNAILNGTYTLIVDSYKCGGQSSATVVVNTVPSLSILSQTDVTCYGDNDGTVALSVTGGTAPYLFDLNGMSTLDGIYTGLAPGTYAVNAIDDNGCEASTDSVTITEPDELTLSAGSNSPVCSGMTVQLNSNPSGGSPSYSYSWTGPGSFTSSAQNPSISGATASDSGTYSLTVTDDNGCTITSSTVVTVNTTPSVSISPSSGTICSGASITLTASGASSYSWSPSTGLNTTTGSSVIANPSSTSSYTVTGTSSSGCTATKSVTVTVNNNPTVTATASPSSMCASQVSTLTASGASTYSWSPSSGLNSTTDNPVYATLTVTTTYTVTGTASNGCTGTGTVTVTIISPSGTAPSRPGSISGHSQGICGGQESYSCPAVSGASSYTWFLPTGCTFVSGMNTNSIVISIPGNFISGPLCVQSNNGTCKASTSKCLNPIQSDPARATITGSNPACSGTPTTYTTTIPYGATGYSWGLTPSSSGSGSPSGTSYTVNWNSNGTVILHIANGCDGHTDTKAVTVNSCRFTPEESLTSEGEETFHLQPNPAGDYVDVFFNSDAKDNGMLILKDIIGRTLFVSQWNINKGESKFRLNLNGYTADVYFVELVYGNKAYQQKLVVVK